MKKQYISIKTYSGMATVAVVYRTGNVFVHKTLGRDRFRNWTVSNTLCGYAYRQSFTKLGDAKFFADYLSSIKSLNNLKSPEEVRNVSKKARLELKKTYKFITGRDW